MYSDTPGCKMMQLPAVADARRNGIKVVPKSYQKIDQRDRIVEAIGLGGHLPRVDEETLARYYTYLTPRLSFPFTAYTATWGIAFH